METANSVRTGFPVVTHFPRNWSSPPLPRTCHVSGELRHHYLDACFRCERTLAGNKDVFMYRCDTPFCSEDCRQQQINTDEEREKGFMLSAAARREQKRQRQSPRRILVWAR